jgi:hypothetical protein
MPFNLFRALRELSWVLWETVTWAKPSLREGQRRGEEEGRGEGITDRKNIVRDGV